MTFSNDVVSAGTSFQKASAAIDSVVNSKLYYKENRDVIIINTMRNQYREVFPQIAFPRELLYNHELSDAANIRNCIPSIPGSGKYQPPFVLPDRYQMQRISLGNNAILQNCRNAIIEIQDYLNSLNSLSEQIGANLITTYGHKNDSVRFMGLLMINVLTELSKMNLTDRTSLVEANAYVEYFTSLQYEISFLSKLRQYTPLKQHPHLDRIRTPCGLLDTTVQHLKEIQGVIRYRLSVCSIFEHTDLLSKQMQTLSNFAFYLLMYLPSERLIMQTETMIQNKCINSASEPLVLLQERFRKELNSVSSLEETRDTHALNFQSQKSVSAKRDVLNFNWDIQALTKENSGVYWLFRKDARVQQAFAAFCSQLVTLIQLHKSLNALQQVLRTGGDLIAVKLCSEQIELMLTVLQQLTADLSATQQSLIHIAKIHYHSLLAGGEKNLRNGPKNWIKNYAGLAKFFQDEALVSKTIPVTVSDIRAVLNAWSVNPNERLDDFFRSQAKFNNLLIDVYQKMASTNEKFEPGLNTLKTLSGGVSAFSSLPAVNQKKLTGQKPTDNNGHMGTNILLPEDTDNSVIEDIVRLLERYAAAHGFTLTKLQLKDDRIEVLCGFNNPRYTKGIHKQRGLWIADCLTTCLSKKKEDDLLEELKHKVHGALNHRDFKSRNKGGISDCIKAVNRLIEERLAELSSRIVIREIKPENIKEEIKLENMEEEFKFENTEEEIKNSEQTFDFEETEYETNSLEDCILPDDQPGIHIQEQNSSSMLVEEIRRWVDSCSTNPATQILFIRFWEKLCYLKLGFRDELHMNYRSKKDRQFTSDAGKILKHTILSIENITTEQSHQFLNKIDNTLSYEESGNCPHEMRWAIPALKKLMQKELTENQSMKQWVDTSIETKEKELITVQQKLRQYRQNELLLSASGEGLSASEVRLNALCVDLEKLGLRQNPEKEKEYLNAISARLLQIQINDVSDNCAFDDLLEEVLNSYAQAVEEKEQTYWKTVGKGLLALGADPLPWLKQPKDNTLQQKVLFLISEQVDRVLASFIVRAQHLGESALHLKHDLSHLIEAIRVFSTRLYRCVKTDDAWWWFGNAKGARTERAAILHAALNWIHAILNDDKKFEDGKGVVRLEQLNIFYGQLKTAMAEYEKVVKIRNKLYNNGLSSFQELRQIIKNVKHSLETMDHCRVLRLTVESAFGQIETYKEKADQEHRARLAADMDIKNTKMENQKLHQQIMDSFRSSLNFTIKGTFNDKWLKKLESGHPNNVPDKLQEILDHLKITFPTLDEFFVENEVMTTLSTKQYHGFVSYLPAQSIKAPVNLAPGSVLFRRNQPVGQNGVGASTGMHI